MGERKREGKNAESANTRRESAKGRKREDYFLWVWIDGSSPDVFHILLFR
jgi:hypothetical protein